MKKLILKAKQMADEKHAHLHLYNSARSPAIIHIGEVARLVEQHGGNDAMICAAWLHDIVEDTDTTLSDIEDIFGQDVAEIIDGLTDPDHFSAMPLQARKQRQAERVQEKSNAVKIVKICDQTSNVRRVADDPPTDWDTPTKLLYIEGAKIVVDSCKGVHPALDKLFKETYLYACAKYKDIK